MVFIKKLKILLVYCLAKIQNKSRIIKLACNKNHESSLVLESFIGSKTPHKTISVDQSQDTVYLNNENKLIRVLYDYKNNNFQTEISIPLQKKIHQVLPFGKDKIVILDNDSKVSIMEISKREKKTRFLIKNGNIYTKAEHSQKEQLDTMTFCPKEEYLCITSKKPSQGKKVFGYSKLFILRLKKKQNGALMLEKCYQMGFSYNYPKSADVLIPFYNQGMPVLAILEEKVGSRVYFYRFTGRECKKFGNTVVGTNVGCNQSVALKGSMNVFKILKEGFVYKVSFR